MRATYRYGLAVVTGLFAAGFAFVSARPAVESPHVSLVAGSNLVVWTLAVALVADVRVRLDDLLPTEGRHTATAAKMGGLAGFVSSVALGGAFLALANLVPFRYASAVALFVFGAVLASLGVGMRSVVARLRAGDERTDVRDAALAD